MAGRESASTYAAAEDLVKNPRETLARELKEWLDPSSDEDKANLVRAILAMCNSEFGGLIAIGISKDGSHQQAAGFDVEAAYQQEAIQAIVSKHASRSFEVEVYWVELNGVRYPVIVVPGAADTPAVCKSAIGQGQKPHLRESAIYVRTLDASGIPSSAQAMKITPDNITVFFQKKLLNFIISIVLFVLISSFVNAHYKEIEVWMTQTLQTMHVPIPQGFDKSPERKIVEAMLEKGFSVKVPNGKSVDGIHDDITWLKIKGTTGEAFYSIGNDLLVDRTNIAVEFKKDAAVFHFTNKSGEKWETTASYADMLKMKVNDTPRADFVPPP